MVLKHIWGLVTMIVNSIFRAVRKLCKHIFTYLFGLHGEHAVHLVEVVAPHWHSLPKVDETFTNIRSVLIEDLTLESYCVIRSWSPQTISIKELFVLLLVACDRVRTSVEVIGQGFIEVVALGPVNIHYLLNLVEGHSHFLELSGRDSLHIISQ